MKEYLFIHNLFCGKTSPSQDDGVASQGDGEVIAVMIFEMRRISALITRTHAHMTLMTRRKPRGQGPGSRGHGAGPQGRGHWAGTTGQGPRGRGHAAGATGQGTQGRGIGQGPRGRGYKLVGAHHLNAIFAILRNRKHEQFSCQPKQIELTQTN